MSFPQMKEIVLPTLEEQAQQLAKVQAQPSTQAQAPAAQTGGGGTGPSSAYRQKQPATTQTPQQGEGSCFDYGSDTGAERGVRREKG